MSEIRDQLEDRFEMILADAPHQDPAETLERLVRVAGLVTEVARKESFVASFDALPRGAVFVRLVADMARFDHEGMTYIVKPYGPLGAFPTGLAEEAFS